MITQLAKRIDALPPLPKTVLELQDFKKQEVQETTQLLKILEQDPLIMATLLKVSNSAMFGFRHKVETTKKAVDLIGVNFTLSIAFGSAVKSTLNTNLDAYGLSADRFLELANMSSNILHKWVGSWDFKLKEELILPVFLQETGQFVLSDLAHEYKITKDFYQAISKDFTRIPQIEKQLLSVTSSDVAASIFEQWKLNDSLVSIIKGVSDISKCDPKFIKHAQVLSVIKVLCNPIEPLSSKAVEKAIEMAKDFKLDTKSLEKAIEVMEDRLLNA
ncbi:MAG: HDOD domain-containing protein [Arcobacter sp.]|nr:HDOD domain-containing protein [Arcobacter sp.]